MWEYYRRTVCNQADVPFGTTTNKILIIILIVIIIKQTLCWLFFLHMSQLIFTVGVESYASNEPHDADYLKASWQKTHHCVFSVNSRYMVCNFVNTASRNLPVTILA